MTVGFASSLTTMAAEVPTAEAERLADRHYGLPVRAKPLIGERDRNFALQAADGRAYVLKLVNPAEDPDVTEFQTQLLLHIARADPGLPAQRVIPTLDGAPQATVTLEDGTRSAMRLVSYLPGSLLRSAPPSDRQRRNLGRILARTQLALQDLQHLADRYDIAWDLRHAGRIRMVVPDIADPERRALLERALAVIEARALPAMAGLRAQVVHNDLSYDNVLVDPADTDQVTGVLDFGDATRTPLINDVAIAAAYYLADGAEPLAGAAVLVAGFQELRPLLAEELALLPDLILARMVIRVGITEWRAARFPDNRAYILRNTALAWRYLEHLVGRAPGFSFL